MPTYCYRASNGEIFDKDFPAGEAPDEIFIEPTMIGVSVVPGEIATRYRQAEVAGMHVSVVGSENRTRQPNNTWPMDPCFASGVHPDQAQDLRDHLRGNGVTTEVTAGGDPIYTSAAHRKKALKARGMYDRNAFN